MIHNTKVPIKYTDNNKQLFLDLLLITFTYALIKLPL